MGGQRGIPSEFDLLLLRGWIPQFASAAGTDRSERLVLAYMDSQSPMVEEGRRAEWRSF